MLQIHFSNRLEVLREALLAELGRDAGGVFEAQELIVASAAMRRHLTLAVADRDGICTNLRFSYLAQWLWTQIGRWVPTVAAESPFAPAVLGWRVLGIFRDPAFLAAQPRLGDYLRDADEAMRYELALRCAALIEQTITYRPDWLETWSDSHSVFTGTADAALRADEAWQAALWRRIAADLGTDRQHPALLFLRRVEQSGAAAAGGLPKTAHVFALPSIPPLYLGLLQQLSRWVDLHLYVLNPCREYWFEIIDPRRLAGLAVAGDTGYHEVGNPLLARWGRQTQAQLGLLLGQAGEAATTHERFVANPQPTLLARLQNAMLDLAEIEAAPLADDDRSIELHVCHSLLRELEVLQSRLLALFADADPPQPADIVVVMPDLDAAAPLIEAVFGTAPAERYIPYVVSGRARSRQNAAAQALLGVLALAASRWRASEVVDLLQQPLVGRRFGLEGDASLGAVRGWLADAGIRWGFDAAHRGRLGLPVSARHGFDDGLQRLYLGYALPDAIDAPFNARLPAGRAEGSAAVALGGLQHFVDALARLQRGMAEPLGADAWLERLDAAIDDFILPAGPVDEDDLAELRSALRELHGDLVQAQFAASIPHEVLRLALTRRLDDPAQGSVPSGAVTFASISGLRHLPFRVVCAINLNDGLFPSPARAPEFDLMAARPRPGDRQRRVDERNLFLDLVLAARERLHLSTTGRSARDNAPLPPSVLVSELLDAVLPAIADDPGSADSIRAVRRRVVVEHPLQPFTPASFDADGDRRLRSFETEYLEALQQAPPAAAPLRSCRTSTARTTTRPSAMAPTRRLRTPSSPCRCPSPMRPGGGRRSISSAAFSATRAATCSSAVSASRSNARRTSCSTTNRCSPTTAAAAPSPTGCCPTEWPAPTPHRCASWRRPAPSTRAGATASCCSSANCSTCSALPAASPATPPHPCKRRWPAIWPSSSTAPSGG